MSSICVLTEHFNVAETLGSDTRTVHQLTALVLHGSRTSVRPHLKSQRHWRRRSRQLTRLPPILFNIP